MRVEILPWIRGFKACQVQQSFIHNGNGAGHWFTISFFDGYREFLLRFQRIFHRNHRSNMGGRIFNRHRLNTVHPNRKIIFTMIVRLDIRNVNVDIRSHFGRHFKLKTRVVFFRRKPEILNYFTSCFNTY